ncbi:MAG: hypothetical protein M1839_002763 [Geoglossum umbratile]|nr:MAG: hypothetical protein M1839_002763 [Geoglossum umbratile]
MEIFPLPELLFSLYQSTCPSYADSRSALEYIRALSAGQVSPEKNEIFYVRSKEYKELVREIEKDPKLNSYFTLKLHHDYDHRTNELFIRMKSRTHETFLALFSLRLHQWLVLVACDASNPTGATIAKHIRQRGSPSISMGGGSHREPDITYGYDGYAEPSFVVEVGCSQSSSSLKRKAAKYILATKGQISVAIALDIYSKGSSKATTSMWRAAIVTRSHGREVGTAQKVMDRKEFRLEDGSPAEGVLVIRLSDLVPKEIAQWLKDEDADVNLEILHSDLAKDLEVAEADEELLKARERKGEPYGRGLEWEDIEEVEPATVSPPPSPEGGSLSRKRKRG